MIETRMWVAILAWTFAGGGMSFANVGVGDQLENVSLARTSGGKQTYLGKAKANVFIFMTPGQPFSAEALGNLAELQKELAGKPVEWVVIMSDKHAPADGKAVLDKAQFKAPLLLDPGDALYGKLGARLTPVVGVADAQHRLTAYVPFMKVHHAPTVRAWILRTLGELDDAKLEAMLHPPPQVTDFSETQVARRWFKMGERQLASGQFEKAADTARKSLAKDPGLAEGHGLLALALANLGQCEEAWGEIALAFSTTPSDPRSREAQARCSAPLADGGSAAALDGGTSREIDPVRLPADAGTTPSPVVDGGPPGSSVR